MSLRNRLQRLTTKQILTLAAVLLVAAVGASIAVPILQGTAPAESTDIIMAEPAKPAAPGTGTDQSTTILELFNPSDESLTNQLSATVATQQIEQIMASSFVLVNCRILKDDAYRDSFKALIIYAQRQKLASNEAEAQKKLTAIAQAANASYGMLYSRTKCDDPKLPRIAKQLLAWQNAYLAK